MYVFVCVCVNVCVLQVYHLDLTAKTNAAAALEEDVSRVHFWVSTPKTRSRLVALGVPQAHVVLGFNDDLIRLISSGVKQLLWILEVNAAEAFRLNLADAADKLTMEQALRCALPSLCARLFGGRLADQAWLRICEQEKKVIRGIVNFDPAIAKRREICVHEHLHKSWLHKVVQLCGPLHSGNRSFWTVRPSRVAIKDSRTAWVLCLSPELVEPVANQRGKPIGLNAFFGEITHIRRE